ncbi:response regulator [Marinospirillum perlucidum]|uniref:response regulator n=1 Tax=Marinospirillum perlucidum TaxID=1982602 RepID=UPI000DF2F0A6|nr:response regulator [Marinospirillum perlucidum]
MVELRRVFCVEDDPDIRMLVQMALAKLGGLEVCLVESAEIAQQEAAAFKPDLFLLDVMLPGMTGLEFFQLTRQDPELAEVPAVLLTAKVSADYPETWKQPGILGLIEKPFNPVNLASQLHTLFDASKQM